MFYNWGFEPFSVLFLSFRAIGVFYNWVCMHMESCNKSRSKKSLCKRIQIITVRNVSVADIHFNHTTNRDRIKIKKFLHDPLLCYVLVKREPLIILSHCLFHSELEFVFWYSQVFGMCCEMVTRPEGFSNLIWPSLQFFKRFFVSNFPRFTYRII